MYKFYTGLKKEFRLLLVDKAGFAMMFLMPIILVMIGTVIQDNAFDVVKGNRIELLYINQDEGNLGGELSSLLDSSSFFQVQVGVDVKEEKISSVLLDNNITRKRTRKSHFPKTR